MTPRPTIFNKVLERLKDNAAEDTMRMGSEVAKTVSTDGWVFVQELLAAQVQELDMRVEQGLHEHVEYAAMIAERRALRNLQAVADAVVEAGLRAEQHLTEMAAQMAAGEDHHGR